MFTRKGVLWVIILTALIASGVVLTTGLGCSLLDEAEGDDTADDDGDDSDGGMTVEISGTNGALDAASSNIEGLIAAVSSGPSAFRIRALKANGIDDDEDLDDDFDDDDADDDDTDDDDDGEDDDGDDDDDLGSFADSCTCEDDLSECTCECPGGGTITTEFSDNTLDQEGDTLVLEFAGETTYDECVVEECGTSVTLDGEDTLTVTGEIDMNTGDTTVTVHIETEDSCSGIDAEDDDGDSVEIGYDITTATLGGGSDVVTSGTFCLDGDEIEFENIDGLLDEVDPDDLCEAAEEGEEETDDDSADDDADDDDDLDDGEDDDDDDSDDESDVSPGSA